MAEHTPDFLASLGVALSRLNEQLGEASQAYQDCLARYAEEKQHLVGKADYEWDEPGDEEAVDGGRDLEAPADVFEARDDDAAPPARLPQPPRTSFFVAPAVPAPKGDAPPHLPHKAWTKVVRLEAEHGAADHGAAQVEALLNMSGSGSNIDDKLEVVSEVSSVQQVRVSDSGLMERTIGQRLLPRLGHRSTRALVSGHDLHQAVSAMGLERYTLKEMNYLVYRMSVLIKLEFRQLDKPGVTQPLAHHLYVRRSPSELTGLSERAVWVWPDVCKDGTWQRSTQHGHAGMQDMPADQHGAFIPIKALIKAMTAQDVVVKKLLGSTLCEQLFAIKEVLVTGDANRLVSELTCVRIDDLATRSPEPEFSVLELIVGLLVIANGVVVGMQTQEEESAGGEWLGWFWIEAGFTCAFLLEILLRLCRYGVKPFFCGSDYAWNFYDVLLVAVGIVECGVTTTHESDVSYSPMLRFIRLLKLMRLVRIFRLQFMWELQLMIKGLLGGARTLFWALVLLVFVLYILGVLTYAAFSDDADEYIRELFADIPTAMFTAFRCVTSDCFTRAGTSATGALMHSYGLKFGATFFAAYIGITLGVFNVILAIYVETTMTAAKQTEDANKGSKERASIRVAHVTKRLLKLFCAAERSFDGRGNGERRPSLDMKSILNSSGLDSTEIHDSTSISKELFLMVIQEPEVKKLMDELDLPPDRANLFDSIDADGSGSLEATELVRGLLKVRGEVKKSDQVACILALRAVQATLREMGANLQDNRRMLEDLKASAMSPGASRTE